MIIRPQLLLAASMLFFSSLLPATDDAIEIARKKREPLAGYQNGDFSINLSAGILTDYTFFDQDSTNITQIGKQKNQFDLRAFRAAIYGQFKLWDIPVTYLVACGFSDYMTRDAKKVCNLFDAMLAFTLPNDYGIISIGKMKEPWSYEMVGDSASLIQSERLLSPLFRSRNVGIRYNNAFFEKRMTFALGIYNDWADQGLSFQDGSRQFTTRMTYLPYITENNADYLHIGLSFRYNVGENGQLRYKGKPESNVADWFVDTGLFDADHARELGIELLGSYHGLNLLGEYMHSNVSSGAYNNPHFYGWYVEGSWVITGESRPYDRRFGFARRIRPQGKWGAPELMVRYGMVDLDDGAIHGGSMKKWTTGINWWINDYWKASLNTGRVTLDRFGSSGESMVTLFRLQWFR